jgi:hypothetical protein
MILSATKQEALCKEQECFRAANFHLSTTGFRQLPITMNICKGYVHALTGVEIQARYRTACHTDYYRETGRPISSDSRNDLNPLIPNGNFF